MTASDADVEAVARAIDPQAFVAFDKSGRKTRARDQALAASRRAMAADRGRKRMEESLREMLDACAACMRVVAAAGLSETLQAELAQSGIQDGFGVRARAALDGGTNG